jgi:hypothetical protein
VRVRGGLPIDITFLVGRLEELIGSGRRLPTTSMVIVDRELALGFIDELRAAIPEEVSAAKRISAEGARIVEKAREEAERTIGRAQEQAAFLIEERGLTQAAEKQSAQIVAAAQAEAAEIRRGADEYAASVLIGLEGDMVKTLQAIKKGIAMLDERRSAAAGQRPSPPAQEPVEEEEPAGASEPARW